MSAFAALTDIVAFSGKHIYAYESQWLLQAAIREAAMEEKKIGKVQRLFEEVVNKKFAC